MLLRLSTCILRDNSTKGNAPPSSCSAAEILPCERSLSGGASHESKLLVSLRRMAMPTWSTCRRQMETMKKGEAYPKRRSGLRRWGPRAAHAFDPQCYYAAQFFGDVYFHWEHGSQQALVSLRLNRPGHETTYRYGDVWLLGRMPEAMEKYAGRCHRPLPRALGGIESGQGTHACSVIHESHRRPSCRTQRCESSNHSDSSSTRDGSSVGVRGCGLNGRMGDSQRNSSRESLPPALAEEADV